MAEKPSYAGKITPAGAQKVEAPVEPKVKKGTTPVKGGGDLRTGS